MGNYPQELSQDAVCQSHTGHMTGLWFLLTRSLSLNTNERMRILTPSLTLATLHFSHDRSNQSSPSLYSTKSQNFAGIFEVSQLQHLYTAVRHMWHCLLVSSLNLSPVCWCKQPLLATRCLYRGNLAVHSTCTFCTICYPATLTVDIFQNFFNVLLTVNPNAMIVFFYQLDAQILYFNTFITFLYMFRALLCSSSGGQLY